MTEQGPTSPSPAHGVSTLGVLGAGTMGGGIAEAAALNGIDVILVDAAETALAAASRRLASNLQRAVDRGRLDAAAAAAARDRVSTATELGALAGANGVIEAVSERLELKRELFARLAEICPEPALLATNTSSLLVSSIAATLPSPARLVGMHFFNPVPRMKLVEVVPGLETSEQTTRRARSLGEGLGKRVIVAKDGIGFLVNRAARPFAAEALRLAQERVATIEQIDRICRMGGGFRMGPFELVDLIGVDVNLEITESFWFQSYGEPRWRPSPIQRRLVDAGRLGRKSGAGFYSYAGEAHREPDPNPPPRGGGEGRPVSISGRGAVADSLRELAAAAGFLVGEQRDRGAWLAVEAGPESLPDRVEGAAAAAPRAILCAGCGLGEAGDAGAAGFHLIGPVAESRLVELTNLPTTTAAARERARDFFAALGMHAEEVADAPGLVLGRIVAQLVNEAAFAVGEGVADPDDVDAGTTLGLNHPRGPIAWSEAAGLDHIRAVLAALHSSRGEERYRQAPLLQGARSLRER